MNQEPLFDMGAAFCAHGSVSIDGGLGYDCLLTGGRVRALREADGAVFLSAHAPSRVKIVLHRPVRVTGFLNVTARWMPENPAVFLVNENPLGLTYGPLDETLPLTLEPGHHVMRTVCQRMEHRHTVWRIDPVTEIQTHQLALVTAACYPEADSWRPLWHLCQSAVRQNRWLHVMGVGSNYGSHYDAKVARLREFIAGLDSEFVLFADGKDSLLVGAEEELLTEFARMKADFVISMERGTWPVVDHEWRAAFHRGVDGRHFPNAGAWMGTKAGVLRVLGRCIELRAMARTGKLSGSLARWRKFANRLSDDDQGLMQLCYLEGSVEGDHDCRIFTDAQRADRRILGNEEFEFLGGRVRVRATGAMPQVIHFPGAASRVCRDQWAAILGIPSLAILPPTSAGFHSSQNECPKYVNFARHAELMPEDMSAVKDGSVEDFPLWVYWECGPMPGYLEECLNLIRQWHPGRVRLVSWEMFEKKLWTRDRDLTLSDLHIVTRCDWIRLYLLRWYGGMYADVDCIPLRNWNPWMHEALSNAGGFCGFGSTKDHVATSLMAARAGGLAITLAYEAATYAVRHKRPVHWLDLNSGVMTPALRGRESLCRIYPIEEVQPIGWWEQACYFDVGEWFPLPENVWCLMLSNQQLGERARRVSREEWLAGRTRLGWYLRESRRRASGVLTASYRPATDGIQKEKAGRRLQTGSASSPMSPNFAA